MKTLNYKLSVKIVFQNRSNSVTFDRVTSNVVFVTAVFTLLESQEGDTINISRGETQSDPHQSKAAALSEDTAGFVTWPSLGLSVNRNVLQ